MSLDPTYEARLRGITANEPDTMLPGPDLAALLAEIDWLRGLLRETLEMEENWPGIAYSNDLAGRCHEALKGQA